MKSIGPPWASAIHHREGSAALSRLEGSDVTAPVDASVRCYRVEISDKELDGLRSRIAATRRSTDAAGTYADEAHDVLDVIYEEMRPLGTWRVSRFVPERYGKANAESKPGWRSSEPRCLRGDGGGAVPLRSGRRGDVQLERHPRTPPMVETTTREIMTEICTRHPHTSGYRSRRAT
jgi:hypothetical protein